jgi:hypothetical protein
MRNKLTSKSIVSAGAAAAMLFVAAPAFALSVTGYSGKPQFPANTTGCMVEASGAVFNNCGVQVNWEIPMAVNPGFHTVTLSTNNPGGGTFQCQLFGVSQTGVFNPGTTVFPNGGNFVANLSVTVPTNGSMLVFCNVNPNGKIFNVLYSE